TFDEARYGFDEKEVSEEAKRCFSCGTCTACDNCYIFCPDAAITPVKGDPSRLYIVDYEYCKGCGLCAAECPRACIVMKSVR
ncbi:MAG: 4Fe-4S binding protein, partial [Candidatus Electryoneaceae bacterium]|nr:4Fe-4S binding protein [Candidatus Electryoneaceae bacterium]